MALTFKLTDGTTDIDLVYNSGSQPNYAMQYGARLQAFETDVLEHIPDYGEAKPVRGQDKNRVMYMTMHVVTDDSLPDTILNKLSELKRWVDGEDQQALRYHTDDDTNEILLQVAIDGATNTTNHSVMWGFVDDSKAWYHDYKKAGDEFARNVVVMLKLEPYGKMATTSSPRNDLASSPHFVEDTDSDGLADGWTEQLDVDTLSIDTTAYLLGGQSQKLVVDGVHEDGIISDTVTNAADTTAVGYIWAYITASTWNLTLYDVDAPGPLDTVNMDATGSNADTGYSRVDAAGNTWYRYTVSEAAIPANNDVSLWITLGTASASTVYLDGAYLQLGTTTAPDVFASTASIENRMDPSVDESNINYIDIGLIPGDAPAQMLLTNTFANAADDYQVWCLEQDGKYNATAIPYVIENTSFALVSGTGTYTANDGAGAFHGGNYGRYDAHAGVETGGQIGYNFSAADSAILAGRVFKVIVACQSNDAAGTIALDIGTGDGTVKSRTAGIAGASNYELKYVGLYRVSPLLDSEAASIAANLYLDIAGIGLSKTFDIDAVFLMPVDKGAVIAKQWSSQTSIHIDGPRNAAYTDHGFTDYIGKPFDLQPGRVMNRVRVLNYGSAADDYDITEVFPITLTITPRTRHLIGVA